MSGPVRIVHRLALPLALGLGLLAAGACSKKDTSVNSTTGPVGTTPAAPESATVGVQLTDPDIAAIVLAANQADIDNGTQAQGKAKDADVKAFARQMIQDHGSANQKAKDLAGKLQMQPHESPTSQGIQAQQDSVRQALGSKSGGDFDREYIANEVAYHQTVLDAIDHQLLPNAQNADLRQLLTESRAIVQGHLDHARQIQSKLGGGTP